MSWYQQSNNNSWQAAEAEADADVAAVRLGRQNSALKQWQAHAEKLQKALDEVTAMYHNMVAHERAQAKLKNVALDELRKFDPNNKVLDKNYRKQIGDKVREETAKDLINKK